MVAVRIGPIRAVRTDECRHIGRADRHGRDSFRATVGKRHQLCRPEFERNTSCEIERVEDIEFDEALGADDRGIHAQVHRIPSGLDLHTQWIELAIPIRVSCGGQRDVTGGQDPFGFADIQKAVAVAIVGNVVQSSDNLFYIDLIRISVNSAVQAAKCTDTGHARSLSGQPPKVPNRDVAVIVIVKQIQLFIGKLGRVREISYREERQTIDARTRHIDFDKHLGGLQSHVFDPHQADSLGRGAQGQQFGGIQWIGGHHDREAKVEVVENQSNCIRVDLCGNDIAIRVAIYLVVAIGILPVRPLHADEGVDVRGANGHYGHFFRSAHRIQCIGGQTE